MRLNGWQRIGIVASVAWAIYGVHLSDNDLQQRQASARFEFGLCVDRAEQRARSAVLQLNAKETLASDRKVCDSLEGAEYKASGDDQPAYFILYSLAPIPLGWLGAYGLIALFHWIRRGFQSA